ncbi:MAG: hypothetical protein CMB80_20325 [Flammeovirgaceae bacterium]|nr:hypothetical protein [Flammeovirgaceae bacterium]MBE61011.1 hypothetical protein [Flammeovirgaceae bacterium]MBR08407.1 hypothetical protein [Rickettsiales bacterium]HCX24987.1 hypothetical protein [Cytophagales bacterium]
MTTETLFREGDEVVVKSARNPIPMIVRQVYLNQPNNSVKYKCSWQLFDGRISNTIYDHADLEFVIPSNQG